jgi:hypothetical protein
MYQPRAPSIRFFLANGWESTNLKERNQAVKDLAPESFIRSTYFVMLNINKHLSS